MADQCCSENHDSNPWKKLDKPHDIVDVSSWPALCSERVPSPEVIIPQPSSLSATETTAEESSTIPISLSVCVDDSPPVSEYKTVRSMSSSSSSSPAPSFRRPRPVHSESSREYSYGHNQNHHQHYHTGRLGPNQRGNGFNMKGGNKGGDGLSNQNFSNRRYQQPRGFNNWNHKRDGFNANVNARYVNSQQHSHHGFVNGPFGPPPPPFPHSFAHSTPMVSPPYVNVNVNIPPSPSPAPIPGYMLPFGHYGNAYFPVPPLPPVPSPPPYLHAMSGPLTYNQPIFPNPEVELCNRLLHQIEYYFSKDNLVKDTYFKSLMDDEGWVSVHLIAEFRRVKAMTSDVNLIVKALQPSAVVEVQGNYMRKRGDWMTWVQHCSTVARSSVTDISTGMEKIQLSESAGADALVADDLDCLHEQMKGSDAS